MREEMLEQINELKEILESGNFKELNSEQIKSLEENFNKRIGFEYLEDGGYVFLMKKHELGSFEYYLGMEYETPENKIELDDNVLIVYNYGCERARELFDLLEENEED
jgi:hypothetical protein